MLKSASNDERLWFGGFCHMQNKSWQTRKVHQLLKAQNVPLIVHHHTQKRQPGAKTKHDHERNNKVNDDIRLIRFPRLAVVLRVTTLAFDMGEHGRPKRASPPCVTDFGCVALSAIGTGGVLWLWLHGSPPWDKKMANCCHILHQLPIADDGKNKIEIRIKVV